jgi:DNA-binding CsgD family transcriptional regulator
MENDPGYESFLNDLLTLPPSEIVFHEPETAIQDTKIFSHEPENSDQGYQDFLNDLLALPPEPQDKRKSMQTIVKEIREKLDPYEIKDIVSRGIFKLTVLGESLNEYFNAYFSKLDLSEKELEYVLTSLDHKKLKLLARILIMKIQVADSKKDNIKILIKYIREFDKNLMKKTFRRMLT